MTQTIVVFVPGITGSSLIGVAGTNVWPVEVALAPNNAVAILSQLGIQAGVPILSAGTSSNPHPVYAPFVDYFTNTLGFQYVTQNQPLPDTRGNVLIGYGYDWRQPNQSTAQLLASYLQQKVVPTYPGAQLWLVAHSMGGLVCRYILEAIEPAGVTVQGLITLGTPHLGAPLALSAITDEANLGFFLSPAIIAGVVDMPKYPSAFQLLPPPQQTFVTDASGTTCNIYSGTIWQLLTTPQPQGFGAPPASITAAADFFQALNYGSAQDGRPNYYVVYGSGFATITAFLYSPGPGLAPQQELMQSASFGGDAVVPQWSASFPSGWVKASYAAGRVTHGGLVADPGTLAQVAQWMNVSPVTALAEVPPPSRATAS